MQYTDLDSLRAAFTELVRAIVPDHPRHQDDRWSPVERPTDAAESMRRRNFCCQFGFAACEGQIYSEAWEWQVPLRIWTSYAGLDDHEPQSMAFRDGRQILITLADAVDTEDNPGTVPGLISVTAYEGFEAISEDSGEVFGSHNFTIKFLAADS